MITVDDYKNPYGTWMVTTEGDCEGRSKSIRKSRCNVRY